MKKLLYILLFVPLALFGQENYSMNFDGSNNFIEINHHPSLVLSNLSISFWMKTSNTNSGIKSLIAKENFSNDDVNGEWWVYMNHASQNKINFYVIENNTQGGVTHSSFLNDNIWHFVSITRNGDTGEQIITVDGQNPIFSYGPSGILSEPVSLFIGGGNNYNYNGLIDNVAIWNTILTPEDLALHMHCPLTGQEEGLVGYWNFNEGSGNTVYDISGYGNDGTINGAQFSEDVPEQNCFIEELSNLTDIDGFSYGGFYDSSYYFVSQELASWEEANTICNSLGGYLASISSEEENDFISSLLNLELEDGWIGLTDSLIEGDWVWSNGELYEYNNWANNEPGGTDGSSDENHGLIHISGTWNDGYELTYHQYIMEIDAIYGCLNPDYYNYNPQANTSDDSCVMYQEFIIDSLQQALAVFETVEEEQDYSMSFDDYDDRIEVSNVILGNDFSMSVDIKPFDNNGVGEIINIGGDFTLLISEEHVKVNIGNSSNNSYWHYSGANQLSYAISDIEWINLCVNYVNDSLSLYYNGNKVINAHCPSYNISGLLLLGERNYNSSMSYSYGGEIDNVIFWNSAISELKIKSFMSCPPSGNEEGLVGYWNFNEGSGDTVYDLSGNGNHGSINGAIFSEDVPEIYSGCTDANALNYDSSALCDNGSCVFADDVVSNLEESFNQTVSALNNDLDSTNSTLNEVIDTWQSSIDLTIATLDEVSDMNQTIASFTTLIDLQEGWNMIGYGCPEPVNIEQGMSMYTDLVLLIKDNNGSVYLPEFNFNGIGDFTPGYGYQLKLSEPIEDFGLCGDYTTTESPEITDIETDNAQMQNDINCLTGNPEIGDYCYGGIVFYVEEGEEGKYGLVAAMEDLTVEATSPNNWGTNGYEWGCLNEIVDGADGIAIGSGYQNNIDILTQNCQAQNGGLTASLVAVSLEIEGYSDWYLPSKDELYSIYNNISQNSSIGNIGNFSDDSYGAYYWSSTESNTTKAFSLSFNTNDQGHNNKDLLYKVRPIRSFGNWTMGCMDEEACNYNPEANMADGSCKYAQLGYDCEGNITEYVVGMEAEGGIVFYIDETGQHGLVAALEDLTEGATEYGDWGYNGYEWGCYQESVNGANGTSIGTGYQNTIDIVNHECETELGGVTAAQAALDVLLGGYNDWFLPSKKELLEAYFTIGNGGLEGNIAGFEMSNPDGTGYYWSSSENQNGTHNAWAVNLTNGHTSTSHYSKGYSGRVRAIRTF